MTPATTRDAVNLESELGGTVKPDSAHVFVADDGTRWFEFNAAYIDVLTGREFNITFWATSEADARRRIACLRRTITLTGQIYATVPE